MESETLIGSGPEYFIVHHRKKWSGYGGLFGMLKNSIQ
jgi:coproporphyrinogen III oxidase